MKATIFDTNIRFIDTGSAFSETDFVRIDIELISFLFLKDGKLYME